MIGNNEIKKLKEKLSEEKGKRDLTKNLLKKTTEELSSSQNYIMQCQKARIIVQTVAEELQKKIEYQISNLVSMALAAVFPDPYEFKIKFVPRRNKMEADILFIRNGHEGRPIDIAGGGVLDVASFALKAAAWSIKPTNYVMILDEPFHFLSRDLQRTCSQMVKMISTELGLQCIIVSHIPEITECADRVFNLSPILVSGNTIPKIHEVEGGNPKLLTE